LVFNRYLLGPNGLLEETAAPDPARPAARPVHDRHAQMWTGRQSPPLTLPPVLAALGGSEAGLLHPPPAIARSYIEEALCTHLLPADEKPLLSFAVGRVPVPEEEEDDNEDVGALPPPSRSPSRPPSRPLPATAAEITVISVPPSVIQPTLVPPPPIRQGASAYRKWVQSQPQPAAAAAPQGRELAELRKAIRERSGTELRAVQASGIDPTHPCSTGVQY